MDAQVVDAVVFFGNAAMLMTISWALNRDYNCHPDWVYEV